MGLDPGKKDATAVAMWTPAEALQAMDRTRRPKRDVPFLIITPPAPKNSDPLLMKQVGILDPHILQQFVATEGEHANYFERMLTRKRDHVSEYVQALVDAVKEWHEDMDLSYVVEDHRKVDPRFLRAWLWGPNGEFTGHPRVPAIDGLLREARNASGVMTGSVGGVDFTVQPLWDQRSRANLYDYQIAYLGRADFPCYIRFATYRDYAAWSRKVDREYADGERIRDV